MWKRLLDWLLGRRPAAPARPAPVARSAPARPAPAPAAAAVAEPAAAAGPTFVEANPEAERRLLPAFDTLLFGSDERLPAEALNPVERQVYAQVETQLKAGLAPDSLPKLPMTVGLLLRELQDPLGSQRRIEDLVRRDPALAGDVLRIANSPAYRTGEQPISSIESALRLIGQEALKSIVTAVLMRPMIQIRPIYFLMFGSLLWDQAMGSALAARRLAQAGEGDVEAIDPFVAYFAGLTHSVGRIAIFHLVADTFATCGAPLPPRPHVFRLLMEQYGSILSATIVRHWGVGMQVPVAIHDQSRIARGESPAALMPFSRLLYRARLLAVASLLRREACWEEEHLAGALAVHGLALWQCPELTGLGRGS